MWDYQKLPQEANVIFSSSCSVALSQTLGRRGTSSHLASFGCSGTPSNKPTPAHFYDCYYYCCAFLRCSYDFAKRCEVAFRHSPITETGRAAVLTPCQHSKGIFRWIRDGRESSESLQKELRAGGGKKENGPLWAWWSCRPGSSLAERRGSVCYYACTLAPKRWVGRNSLRGAAWWLRWVGGHNAVDQLRYF